MHEQQLFRLGFLAILGLREAKVADIQSNSIWTNTTEAWRLKSPENKKRNLAVVPDTAEELVSNSHYVQGHLCL